MSEQQYGALAKRRYNNFKKQERREFIKKKVVSFLIKLFKAIVRVLRKARILKRKVETIKVEEG
jgi:hypothetical protein